MYGIGDRGELTWFPMTVSHAPIAIAGGGRLGRALGRILREAGEPVVAVACRGAGHAAQAAAFIGPGVRAARLEELPGLAGRILVTVPDRAITDTSEALTSAGMNGGVTLHTCGAFGPDALAPLAEAGVATGALHPLQTIPTAERGLTALGGIPWGVTAAGPALEWAGRIVELTGGRLLAVPAEGRALYHAAGVLACNCFTALIDAAVETLSAAGVQPGEALEALEAIVAATRENIFELGPGNALTGPILRGDAATVRRHLAALERAPASVAGLYRAAGLQTLTIARRRGLPEDTARRIERLLRENSTWNA